jgi:hypothetical protein
MENSCLIVNKTTHGNHKICKWLEFQRKSSHMFIINKNVKVFVYKQSDFNLNYQSQWVFFVPDSIFLEPTNSNFSKLYQRTTVILL